MKTRLLALSLLFSLAACGGSGGSDSPSPAPVPTPPAPVPAPAPSPTACTSSPVVTNATKYQGIIANGMTGQWQFDTASSTGSYTWTGGTTSETLTRDDATCSYTTNQTGTLRTAFLANGLGVTGIDVNGVQMPVVLVTAPESDLTKVAGTYNVVRYTTEGATVTSDYATFNVDASGNWTTCVSAAYSSSCGGPAGTMSWNVGGWFDMSLNGTAIGRLYGKNSSSSKVVVVAVYNVISSSDVVGGMWVGVSNEAFVSGADDGSYIANSTDPSTDTVVISGLTGTVGTQSATLTPNSPVQGTFTVGASGDVGVLSSLGLYASAAQGSGSNAYFQVGVKH